MTYDYEYIKFKPAVFRNIITINSGSLPYIDSKLDYVLEAMPENLREVLSNLPMARLTDNQREEYVIELQRWLSTQFESRFAELVKTICS